MTRASLGVDVGGTFTDFALWDGRQLITTKSSTTTDQSQAVVEGSAGFGVELASIVHGTTVATNALLERRGADLVFITDAGFTDVPEIGRQDRPALYDSSVDRPEPLVSGPNRIGLGEDIDGAVGDVAAIEPQAVAVSLLYSYRDPDREKALGEALSARLPGAAVSLSSEVVGEFREYERASTTILNAYLAPEMSAYLQRLEDRARGAGIDADIAVMRSSGGLMSPREAGDLPAAALLSGPAGGVVAASQLGAAMGLERLISFDMGGTSTDVCRITGGEPVVSYERAIDGYPCR
ncbi:MAG: hydantoinase/oxoprolinase family protein, partial [Acidimicrobiia bacterium]|nr:hydantoinase/oxoprolinase family protein [Acidimicrobiia bacterium]